MDMVDRSTTLDRAPSRKRAAHDDSPAWEHPTTLQGNKMQSV
jgi:hypothetical protein